MIEDVEYLKTNCDHDATVIYIDSADRDRRYFPNPEEYTVTFEQPFKLVIGFDILDASIPTTMWNVDRYNGSLAITTCSVPTSTFNKKLAEAYFDELRDCTNFHCLFERGHLLGLLNENFVVVITKQFFDSQDISDATTKTPYFAYVRSVLSNTPIKQAPRNLDTNSYYTFNYRGVTYYVETTEVDLIDILKQNNFDIQLNSDNLYNLIYFEEHNVTEAIFTSITNAQNYVALVNNYYKIISLGNYDLTTLRTELNNLWGEFNDLNFEATSLPDRKQGIYLVRSSTYVVINAAIGKLIGQIGFDVLPVATESTSYKPLTIGENRKVYGGMFQNDSSTYTIQAPGIVNLLGYRYLILRCKEMEDHLLGSHAYVKYTPGIGLFKLASAYNDVTHLRFDFVNLVRKPFHPIGKLPKLSFRFETQDGDIYDFKGVNHQMLFVIKYLVPTQKVNFNKSILNPNYDPNFMGYMSNNKSIEYKEDSDNEEAFDTKRYDDMYKKEMANYDYSTSNSEASDSDDSELEFDFSQRLR